MAECKHPTVSLEKQTYYADGWTTEYWVCLECEQVMQVG